MRYSSQTIEKHREGQKDIRVTFIDIEKTYDRVSREEIWRCTRERNVPETYVKLIQDMYRGRKLNLWISILNRINKETESP